MRPTAPSVPFFEIERLAAHKLFVATFSCYKSFSFSDVPIGHVRGLEGDEEGLVDVLVKLETSLDELFIPLHVAARNGRTRNHRYSFDELKELFETTMKNVNTFVPMETEDRERASELSVGSSQATIIDSAEVGSSKRAAEAELDHEGSKRQKTNEALGSVQEQPEEEEKELDDLVMLWNLVKERFSSTEPTDDKERTLWVELKRLFEPNTDDTLWKLQRYMHDPLKWRLYDTCGVHHVSTERGIDIFMLVEKEYPLSKGVLTLMLVNRLLVEQHSEMANELLRKIFIQANRPRQ
ncbi:hypothetical protein Tco_0446854 [Tanacetum coccineum]